MNRLTELVAAVTHALHLIEPLLFKLALTALALYELGKVLYTMAFSQAG